MANSDSPGKSGVRGALTFIHLDASGLGQSWAPIRSTTGVSRLVRFGAHPAKVADQLITQLQTRDQTGPPETLFEQGARVVVTEGPFADIEAIYQTHQAHSRSTILLEILSKPVAIRVDTATLRRAEAVR
jgi:transcriptional antiterminator RfaH